jgi:hypothetical protein
VRTGLTRLICSRKLFVMTEQTVPDYSKALQWLRIAEDVLEEMTRADHSAATLTRRAAQGRPCCKEA